MSNLSFPVLPDRAIERLFARFGAIYGHAAMDRHWSGTPLEDVKSAWAEALGRFGYDDLVRGIRALEECGKPFPPSLPEFVALCKAPAAPPPEHRRLLPPPPRTESEIAAGKAIAERISREMSGRPQRDPSAWAYRVIERYRRGEKVAHASYKFAIEALENLGREIPE